MKLPACGITLKAIVVGNFSAGGKVDRGAVVGEGGRVGARLLHLLVELRHPGQAAARHRLVGADHHGLQPGLEVERLEHRHRHHGRAVRVGDDALGDRPEVLRVHLGHHQRHVGVHAPGRGVVDDRGARGRDPRGEGPGGGGAGGEQRDVEAVEVGGVGVLHGELLVAEAQRPPRRPGRGEQPELVEREGPLLEDAGA